MYFNRYRYTNIMLVVLYSTEKYVLGCTSVPNNKTFLLDLKLNLNFVDLTDVQFKSWTYLVSTNGHYNN